MIKSTEVSDLNHSATGAAETAVLMNKPCLPVVMIRSSRSGLHCIAVIPESTLPTHSN